MPLLYVAPAAGSSVTVTSSDGVITAVTDGTNVGVLLRALDPEPPYELTFLRTDASTGVVEAVYSGEPSLVVEGVAYAYDHLASPGATYSYSIRRPDGTESSGAVVSLPALSECGTLLKCPAVPSLSRAVDLVSVSDRDYPSRVSLTTVLDFSAPYAATWVEGSVVMDLVIRTTTKQALADLSALVRSGLTLLLQPSEAHGIDETYCVVTSHQITRPGGIPGWSMVDTVIQVVGMDRPAGIGAPLQMPRWSWADAVRPYGTMTEVAAAYPDMWAMLRAGIGV